MADARSGDRPGLVEIAVLERPSRLHQVARQFRDDKSRHEVSREQLARAVRIVHAIAAECDRRGWTVKAPGESKNGYGHSDWTATKDGHLRIGIGKREFQLRFQEKGVHTPSRYESEWRYRDAGPYDVVATGQLTLEVDSYRYSHDGRQSRFADRASWKRESRLGHLFLELQERVLEADREDEERRIAAEKAAEQERIDAEAREREWHDHIAQAEERLLESARAQALKTQITAWQQATAIRSYCDAISATHREAAETTAWVNWCRAYAHRIAPLQQPPTTPVAPEPTVEALQPFMPDGWRGEGPEVGWRCDPYRYR